MPQSRLFKNLAVLLAFSSVACVPKGPVCDVLYPFSLPQSAVRHLRPFSSPNWLVFSKDGRYLLATTSDYMAFVWETATGRQVLCERVFSWAFSPDGKSIAIGGRKEYRVCDLATGKTQWTIPGKERLLVCQGPLAFSPDGGLLAVGIEGMISIWDVALGDKVADLNGRHPLLTALEFSSDGNKLASAGRDLSVRLWDVSTRRQTSPLSDPVGGAGQGGGGLLAFSPDARAVISRGYVQLPGGDHEIRFKQILRLWDVETGNELLSISDAGSDRFIRAAVSPDRSVLAALFENQRRIIRLWDVATGKERPVGIPGGSFFFSPNGRYLVSWGYGANGAIVVHDLDTDKEVGRTKLPEANVAGCRAVSPDGRVLAARLRDHDLWLIDVDSGKTSLRLRWSELLRSDTLTVFSPNGRYLAAILRDLSRGQGEVVLVDLHAVGEAGAADADAVLRSQSVHQ